MTEGYRKSAKLACPAGGYCQGVDEGDKGLREKSFGIEIFLASLALILLEISYTRVFSFKLFYYFTYLIIGISLLGLGAGAIFVALIPRLRQVAPARLVPVCCLLASIAVPAGYIVVAWTQLNTADLSTSLAELLKLAAICTSVFLPFLLVGVVIATVFGERPAQINRLYFADLLGAGLGCGLCVPLMSLMTPPGCIVLSALILALASMRLAASEWRFIYPLSVGVATALLVILFFPSSLPDPVPDRVKTLSPQQLGESRVLFSKWSPVFRVDVLDISDLVPQQSAPRYFLTHDGMMGSSVLGFNGDLATLRDRFDADPRSLPFSVLGPAPKVLIIGAAGGHEILASLYFRAGPITGVELNPVTVSLLTDHFAEFSGRIAEHSGVQLVRGEGRTFLTRDKGRYDLIWFVAPDSYAAMNAASSGAFVLSESYLYTTEMIVESLSHLTEDGVICVQFGEIYFDAKPNRTTRYLSTAREAFRQTGTENFDQHILLSTTPEFFTMSTILLRNKPFSREDIQRFSDKAALVRGTQVWHPSGEAARDSHPVNKVISLPPSALIRWYNEYPYNVRPVTDESPFFWHFASFRDALTRNWGSVELVWDPEDATGERVLITLLVFSIVFSAAFLLLPLVAARKIWRQIPHKTAAAIYFSALGLGFMFFEICLIQKFTLFLGYPTYSLTVTLFGLLIFAGLGSLLSKRYTRRRNRALGGLVALLVALTILYQFGMAWVVSYFIGFALPVRILVTILLVAPLGLSLGAFMPIGLATISAVTEHKKEFIAWGWAANGFFSVLSTILATILSMTFGFKVVLLLALMIYMAGVAALMRIPEPG